MKNGKSPRKRKKNAFSVQKREGIDIAARVPYRHPLKFSDTY
jgi:hypothetical protein